MKAKTTNSSSGVKSRKIGFTYEELNYKILTDSTCAVDKSQVTGDLIIPEVAHYNDKDYSVTSIGKNAFNKCTDLKTVVIPNSVTSIDKSAFSGCSGLSEVTIPDSVTEIGECAFWLCTDLTKVTIPDSVTKIGDELFPIGTRLTKVTISN